MTYFNSPIAYIFLSFYLVMGNWLFLNTFFFYNEATMRNYFTLLPWIFLFLTPAITMRLWAEEKRSGTIEFLLTLPITEWQAVWGKFLSSLAFLAIALALTITLPLTIAQLGKVDAGVFVGSYLGALFLGAFYLALGLFISALTKNQIIAFIVSVVACFIFFIIDTEFVTLTVPHAVAPFFQFLGVGTHFNSISRGVIDTKDIVYYLSFIILFLWLNKQVIEMRK